MSQGLIVADASGIEKDGIVHIPSHWCFVLKTYGQLLVGTKLLCRRDRNLINKATLPVPEGLEPVLIEHLDSSSITEQIRGYIKAQQQIKTIIRRADFIGAFFPSNLSSMAVSIAMSLQKPFFIEVAGGNTFYASDSFLTNCIRYFAYRYTKSINSKAFSHADLVLYVSQYQVDETPIRPKQYAIVPHVTIYDKDLFRRNDTCTKTPIIIFSANRIVQEKGLQYLLMAVKRLREQNFDIIAILAGDGDYLNELKKKSSELGIDKYVSFTGHVNAGEKLWQLYRQADIMVMPSIATYEGTPKAIIEAMAAGCPVVASSISGVTITLEEAKSGKLVSPGNVDELVEAIKQIILDGELRREYIANGLIWASRITLEKRTEKITKLFLEHFPSILKRD